MAITLALRLAIIGMTLLVWRRTGVARRVAFFGSAVASVMTGVVAARVLSAGESVRGVLLVHRASGFELTYRIDGLSAWFLLVLSVVAVPIAVFSVDYIGQSHFRERSVFVGAAFNVLVGALEIVFMADGVIGFLFAWELFTLITAALVATEHEIRGNRMAAFVYLVMSHLATGCLIAGFLVLGSASGSMSFSTILSGDVVRGPMRDRSFALFFLGFGVKAGIVPAARVAARGASGGARPASPRSCPAVLIKTGIYGMVRVCAFGLGRAEAVLGRDRGRGGRRLGRARRSLCADAARPEAPARLPQHREHRDHPARPRRGDDGDEPTAARSSPRSASRRACTTS